MTTFIRENILNITPYKPGKPIDEVKKELNLKNVIKLASNENLYGPSKKALNAIVAYLPKINWYPDSSGINLREKLANKLGVDKDNIIIGNGSDEIIHLIVLAFLKEGEEVITGIPTFTIYKNNTLLMNGKVIEVQLKDFTFDLKAMKQKVNNNTKLVFIANPNNPTGTIVRKNEVEEFLSDLPGNIITVFDEAYYEYVDDKEYPNTLNYINNKKVIVLRTFSKIYGLAGLRIGYGIANKEIISYLDRVREPFNTSSIAQVAAAAALDDEAYVNKIKKISKIEKAYLYKEFDKLNLQYVKSEANFIFVNMNMDSQVVFQKLLKKGIIVRSGEIFGYNNFIRVTVGKREQNRKFINALKEIIKNG